jgi:hypothetical protein
LLIDERWPRRGKKQTLGWILSSFDETDMKKAKKEGILSESAEVIFPRDKLFLHCWRDTG